MDMVCCRGRAVLAITQLEQQQQQQQQQQGTNERVNE